VLGGRELTPMQREHLDYAVVLRHHARGQPRSTVEPVHADFKTLCLDLDETLIHFSLTPCGDAQSDALVTATDGSWGRVYLRPGVHRFLYQAREMFEIVLFTAANRDYAEQVLPSLDPDGCIFSAVYTREECTEVCGAVVKDLGVVGRPIHQVILVDDQLGSHALHPDNAILIPPYDPTEPDTALAEISSVLVEAHRAADVRDVLRQVYPVRALLDRREYELLRSDPVSESPEPEPAEAEPVAPVGHHIKEVKPVGHHIKAVKPVNAGHARVPLAEVNRVV